VTVIGISVALGWVLGDFIAWRGRFAWRWNLFVILFGWSNPMSRDTEDEYRKKIAALNPVVRMKNIQCCKCWHVGRKLVCRECGHHICMGCKEPGGRA
jgi:hypothetical protein